MNTLILISLVPDTCSQGLVVCTRMLRSLKSYIALISTVKCNHLLMKHRKEKKEILLKKHELENGSENLS